MTNYKIDVTWRFAFAAVALAVLAVQPLTAVAQSAEVAKAQELRLNGKPNESIALLNTVIAKNPNDYLARYNLGLAYANAGNQTAAVKELAAAKQIKTNKRIPDGTIYNSLGWAYLQSGDYTQAVQELKLAKEPTVYASLSPTTKRKVDNNLVLAESYLKVKQTTEVK